MKVMCGIGKIKKIDRPIILAIGIFDGIHLGHQRLLSDVIKRAKKTNSIPAVLTFDPHPVHVLHPRIYLPFIISLEQRLMLFKELGIKLCFVMPFNRKLAHLSGKTFFEKYLANKFKIREIVVGDDFHFGSGRKNSLRDLYDIGEKYSFKPDIVKLRKLHKRKISSTNIRKLIMQGKLAKVKESLGRDYSIVSRVIRGDGRGNKLGFPTANLDISNLALPPYGVYAVKVVLGGKNYLGMASVGFRPTFKFKKVVVTAEVFIFDFSRNIYGKIIKVDFIKKFRSEIKFKNTGALIQKMKEDEVKIRKYFNI